MYVKIEEKGDRLLSVEAHTYAVVEARCAENPTWLTADYTYHLINRDKASLDIFWLRDETLEESDNLPDPGVLAQEIVEDLEAALEQFRLIVVDLGAEEPSEKDQ